MQCSCFCGRQNPEGAALLAQTGHESRFNIRGSVSAQTPPRASIHIFDFFSGPGTDSVGQLGSPLRLLKQLRAYRQLPGWNSVTVHLHFFDKSSTKTRELEKQINAHRLGLTGVNFDVRAIAFEQAFPEAQGILSDQQAAKLVFIDQCGVDQVTPQVFRTLVASPTCDFLFFLSSSTLHRFYEHAAIKQRIVRPDDYFHVHRAALEYYRSLIEAPRRYFLSPFSIKKNSNIYGLIFGSAHPLGIDKFLQVAWDNDEISGEANFDIDRENIRQGEMLLPLAEMRPNKIAAFESELEHLLRNGRLVDELQVMEVCFEYGVKRQHATPVLMKLKQEGVIELDFRVADVRRWNSPRPVRLKSAKERRN
jgi:three-Cys-motif partner protein